MITQNHTLNPILHRQPRIGRRLHALQHNGQTRRRSQPRNIIPIQRRIDIRSHSPAQPAAFRIVLCGSSTHWRKRDVGIGFDAFICFAFAGDGGVDGEEDAFGACGFDLLEEGGGGRAVLVDVELEEEGVVWGDGGDFAEGERGVGGYL